MTLTANRNKFEAYLEEKGLKYTRARKSIYNKVMRLKGHFDAEFLYKVLTAEDSGIARGSVYRNLPLLLECGVIQKSVGDGNREYYERQSEKGHHDHIICLDCSKVIEFHSDEMEKIQEEIAAKHGVKIAFHDHRIYGYCKK